MLTPEQPQQPTQPEFDNELSSDQIVTPTQESADVSTQVEVKPKVAPVLKEDSFTNKWLKKALLPSDYETGLKKFRDRWQIGVFSDAAHTLSLLAPSAIQSIYQEELYLEQQMKQESLANGTSTLKTKDGTPISEYDIAKQQTAQEERNLLASNTSSVSQQFLSPNEKSSLLWRDSSNSPLRYTKGDSASEVTAQHLMEDFLSVHGSHVDKSLISYINYLQSNSNFVIDPEQVVKSIVSQQIADTNQNKRFEDSHWKIAQGFSNLYYDFIDSVGTTNGWDEGHVYNKWTERFKYNAINNLIPDAVELVAGAAAFVLSGGTSLFARGAVAVGRNAGIGKVVGKITGKMMGSLASKLHSPSLTNFLASPISRLAASSPLLVYTFGVVNRLANSAANVSMGAGLSVEEALGLTTSTAEEYEKLKKSTQGVEGFVNQIEANEWDPVSIVKNDYTAFLQTSALFGGIGLGAGLVGKGIRSASKFGIKTRTTKTGKRNTTFTGPKDPTPEDINTHLSTRLSKSQQDAVAIFNVMAEQVKTVSEDGLNSLSTEELTKNNIQNNPSQQMDTLNAMEKYVSEKFIPPDENHQSMLAKRMAAKTTSEEGFSSLKDKYTPPKFTEEELTQKSDSIYKITPELLDTHSVDQIVLNKMVADIAASYDLPPSEYAHLQKIIESKDFLTSEPKQTQVVQFLLDSFAVPHDDSTIGAQTLKLKSLIDRSLLYYFDIDRVHQSKFNASIPINPEHASTFGAFERPPFEESLNNFIEVHSNSPGRRGDRITSKRTMFLDSFASAYNKSHLAAESMNRIFEHDYNEAKEITTKISQQFGVSQSDAFVHGVDLIRNPENKQRILAGKLPPEIESELVKGVSPMLKEFDRQYRFFEESNVLSEEEFVIRMKDSETSLSDLLNEINGSENYFPQELDWNGIGRMYSNTPSEFDRIIRDVVYPSLDIQKMDAVRDQKVKAFLKEEIKDEIKRATSEEKLKSKLDITGRIKEVFNQRKSKIKNEVSQPNEFVNSFLEKNYTQEQLADLSPSFINMLNDVSEKYDISKPLPQKVLQQILKTVSDEEAKSVKTNQKTQAKTQDVLDRMEAGLESDTLQPNEFIGEFLDKNYSPEQISELSSQFINLLNKVADNSKSASPSGLKKILKGIIGDKRKSTKTTARTAADLNKLLERMQDGLESDTLQPNELISNFLEDNYTPEQIASFSSRFVDTLNKVSEKYDVSTPLPKDVLRKIFKSAIGEERRSAKVKKRIDERLDLGNIIDSILKRRQRRKQQAPNEVITKFFSEDMKDTDTASFSPEFVERLNKLSDKYKLGQSLSPETLRSIFVEIIGEPNSGIGKQPPLRPNTLGSMVDRSDKSKVFVYKSYSDFNNVNNYIGKYSDPNTAFIAKANYTSTKLNLHDNFKQLFNIPIESIKSSDSVLNTFLQQLGEYESNQITLTQRGLGIQVSTLIDDMLNLNSKGGLFKHDGARTFNNGIKTVFTASSLGSLSIPMYVGDVTNQQVIMSELGIKIPQMVGQPLKAIFTSIAKEDARAVNAYRGKSHRYVMDNKMYVTAADLKTQKDWMSKTNNVLDNVQRLFYKFNGSTQLTENLTFNTRLMTISKLGQEMSDNVYGDAWTKLEQFGSNKNVFEVMKKFHENAEPGELLVNSVLALEQGRLLNSAIDGVLNEAITHMSPVTKTIFANSSAGIALNTIFFLKGTPTQDLINKLISPILSRQYKGIGIQLVTSFIDAIIIKGLKAVARGQTPQFTNPSFYANIMNEMPIFGPTGNWLSSAISPDPERDELGSAFGIYSPVYDLAHKDFQRAFMNLSPIKTFPGLRIIHDRYINDRIYETFNPNAAAHHRAVNRYAQENGTPYISYR